MGKIRVKTIGDEGLEEQNKKNAKLKREEKKARLQSTESNDEDAPRESAQVESVEKEEATTEASAKPQELKEKKLSEGKSAYSAKKFAKKGSSRSANYTSNAMQIEKNKLYTLTEGIELLKKLKTAKFDETVELHINTTEPGISGTMTLPHGTGKEVRVKVASDEIISEVEKGKISFDILIATPEQMPSLAKVAKILGPRGLMPNPKNGTISQNPAEAAKKFQGGQISFKTESKLPLIHLTIGKISFENSKLKENITTAISSIKKNRIKTMTLKSTMSPGIRLQV